VTTGIDALREPKPVYAFHVLLGHHGVFSMTPLFFFSIVEMFRRLRRRGPFFRETLVICVALVPIYLFYILRTKNYGGWTVGMRWLIPSMGFLLLYFALWLENARLGKVKAVALTLAFAVSSYHVQDGLTSPFQFSQWHNLIDDAPNRNRLGPKWNLPKPKKPPKKPSRKPRTRR
jgi:hypothetical protein